MLCSREVTISSSARAISPGWLASSLRVVHPEDRPTVTRNLQRRFRGETFRAKFRMLRKGGGTVWVEADGRRVLRRGEPVIIGSLVAVDTSRRDRAEARRERQALFRSEKMAALGELLGGVERAAQIVQRFLSFVRDYPPESSLVALNDVVREVVELFDHSLRRARIDLALELADGLPSIWADPHRLHELWHISSPMPSTPCAAGTRPAG